MLLSLLALGGGVIAFRNLRTVGNLSGDPPLAKHVAIMRNPPRLARTQGRFVHPENLPTMLYNYLRPDGIVPQARFPWFLPKPGSSVRRFGRGPPRRGRALREPPGGLPAVAVAGGVGRLRRLRPEPRNTHERRSELRLAVLGSAAGCAAPFIAVYLTLRYLHDLFPFFVIAGAIGLEWLLAMAGRRTWARVGIAVVLLLALYTVAVSVSVTLAEPRWT